MAMIMPDEAIFESSPNPFEAIPKIVGNIRDIKAETDTRAITPTIPWPNITNKELTDAMIAAQVSSLSGFMYRIKKVQMNLEETNNIRDAV